MKILLLFIVCGLCAFFWFKGSFSQAPLRGLAKQTDGADPEMLVSRARPAVAVVPAPSMRMVQAGWCSLSPETRLSQPGNATLWQAAYTDGKGLLVAALAEAGEPWHWQAAHHSPFPTMREHVEEVQDENVHESLYLLAADKNPYSTILYQEDGENYLVYRAVVLLDFQRMMLVVEYQQKVDASRISALPYDLPALNAFQEQARQAYSLLLGKANTKTIPAPHSKMDKCGPDLSRTRLSQWVGPLQRKGDL